MISYYLDGPDLPEPEPELTDAEMDQASLEEAIERAADADLHVCHECGFTVCVCDERPLAATRSVR